MPRSTRFFLILSSAAMAALIVSAAMTQPFQVQAQGGTAAASAASSAYSETDVDSAAAIARIEGDLSASLALWKAGQFQLASTHASHASAQYYGSLAEVLKGKDADSTLKSALDGYQALTAKAGDAKADDVQKTHDAILAALDTTKQTLFGSTFGDLKFQAEVISALLENVIDDFAEGVNGGKITNPVEYQDALSFFVVASRTYDKYVSAAMSSDHVQEAVIIQGQLDLFTAIFPNFDVVKLPDPATDPAQVEKAADLVISTLRKALALPERAPNPVEKAIDEIKEKVEMAISQYKAGQVDDAYETAASAYLDGFEALEANLIKRDKDLVTRVEQQFKDLRDGIKAGAPVADLEKLAAAIAENLQKVEDLLKQ